VIFYDSLSGGRRHPAATSLLTEQLCLLRLSMKILGWVGTALVVVAYYPQIHHLYVERCAWGISRLTWLIWLAASALLLAYCVLRREAMLAVVQALNIAAIVTTLLLVRRSNRVCPYHLNVAETPARR
jgi:lipid-A-disaccharide synthase-like uncharacterized protein